MKQVVVSAALAALLLSSFPPAAQAQDASGVVISQFASRGPGGPNDDFIELFNAGTTPVDLNGWSVRSCFGSTTATFIAQGTIEGSFILPPRGYFLLGGSGYVRSTPADAFFNQLSEFLTMAFNGRSGIQILDATGAVRDGIGSPVSVAQPAGSHCREGAGRATVNTGVADVAYYRRVVGGQPQDSDDNAVDFPGDPVAANPRNLASPVAPAATPRPAVSLSTNAATISESGGVATITATLSAAFTDPVTVGLRFAEFARNGVDYTPSASTITIASGATTGSITLTASDDAVFEGAETIAVVLDSLDNAVRGTPDRVGVTIAENEAVPTVAGPRIYQIQGAAHRSPLVGQTVTDVPGIVTAVAADGFYLQDPDGDGNPATSDAVFVRTAGAPTVTVGSKLAVSGRVNEFRPGGLNGLNNLSVTEIVASTVSASAFPFANGTVAATTIGSGGRVPPAEIIDNDSAGNLEASTTTVFDPAQDGLDFFESLEGMLVQVGNARVIGPSDSDGNLWVIGDNGANATGSNARGGLTVIERSPGGVDYNPERIRLSGGLPGISGPVADVGDSLALARGVLSYDNGSYALRLTTAPAVTRYALPVDSSRFAPGGNRLSVVTYALGNLGPADTARFARIAGQIVSQLGAPDLINLSGVQDDSGTADDGIVAATATIQGLLNAISSAGGPAYAALQIDPINNADGGLRGANGRIVQLYNPARVSPNPGASGVGGPGSFIALLSGVTIGPITPNLSPALLRPEIPAFADSRKPLVAGYRFNGRNLLLVGSHFIETDGDDSLTGLNQPAQVASDVQRRLQATAIHTFVRNALALDARLRVIVLGDFNADDFRPPLRILRNGPLGAGDSEGTLPALVNLGVLRVADAAERYTQIVAGNARASDHILVTNELNDPAAEVQYVHVNSEYADRAADRDAVLASLPLSPNAVPLARALADPTVSGPGGGVSLFDDGSSDSDGAVTKFSWSQVGGPDVSIDSAFSANAGFTAPELDATSVLTFRLTVTDNDGGTGFIDLPVTVTVRDGDFTVEPFSFTPISGVEPGSTQTSNEIIIAGIDTSANLSIVNGSYNIDGGEFVSDPVQVYGGERIRVRTNASANFSTTVTATLSISGVSADFTVRTRDGNKIPLPFSFPALSNAEPGATVVSDSAVITGLQSPSPISISGGPTSLYSINGGPFTAAAGNVSNLDTVRVQQTASTAFETNTVATVVIGGVSGSYSVTTRAVDTTPDAVAFPPVTGATPGATVTSESISISGLEQPASITVVNGLYSIDGGPFTNAMISTVSNGNTVRVQQSASTSFSTTTVTTLTIGSLAVPFSVTTVDAPDTTPAPFAFTPATGAELNSLVISNAITVAGINSPTPISISGGLYSVNNGVFVGGATLVNAGDTVRVQRSASNLPATTTTATLTIGGVSGSFNVTTRTADGTPGAFNFAPVTDAEPGATVTSDSITVSGLEGPAAISVTGGLYSINNGAFTATPGTVDNGNTVRLRLTASAQFSTPVAATLSIGTQQGAFTVTTRAGDFAADAPSFASVTGAELGALVTSATSVVSGLEVPVAITVSGGLYSINNGPFTALAGLISNNDSLRLQQTAASLPATTTTATVSLGGVTGSFSVTTRGADTVPNGFSFAPFNNAAPGAVISSGAVIVSGIEAPATISVVNGQYSINGGAATAETGTIANGDNVRVQQAASNDFAATTTATLNIGGVSAAFNVTTRAADVIPDAFVIAAVSGAAPGDTVISATVFIAGLEAPVPIAVANGRYSINGAAFTAAPGLVGNGAAVRVEHIASAGFTTTSRATLSIGGVTGDFAVTTRAADTSPDAYVFTAVDGTALLTAQISNAITVSGIEVPTPISVINGEYSINGAPFVTPVGIIANGDSLRVRHTSSDRPGTTTVTTVAIGNLSAQYRTTTAAATDPGPGPGPGPGPAPSSGGGGAMNPLWLLALVLVRQLRRRA
ncbi:lamin tail domain-containing protein [uncultured Nevskia sp.]|uniref:lamin tail domain-containing protein n=1 Tax=uncultured Nevskia sp. TaxID=228950 RepID=UPI0025D83ABA|nr:lamin tail domain-containing protein [uncultured Nevskia sp.]